jgi:transcriptional regulator with PAS, ATPase and Fis domain
VLFLDQVTDLPHSSQSKLVAFLETQTFSRLGSAQRRQTRIRLITATNENLAELVASGRFRADLYYRIAVMTFDLPPLREQPELIEELAGRHLRRINLGRKPQLRLSPEFVGKLASHPFSGNIRELINILERAAAFADDVALPEHFIAPTLTGKASMLPPPVVDPGNGPAPLLKDVMQEFETFVLEKSIAENGSKRSAAKALGIDIATLVRKTKRNR